MRDLERTPLLSQDVVVLSAKVKSYIRRLARELAPKVSTIEKRWQRRLPSIFGETINGSHLKALASINPGNWSEVLAAGRMSEFLEQVEYHGRRLAKLDVPPNHVLASLKEYEEALLPDLKKVFPKDFTSYISALDHLYFCVKLTLNNAYYQVRDLEARAFYEVLQDQLESGNVQDLLHRVLETLMRTFKAQGGVILLGDSPSRKLQAKAWKGMDADLAACFDTTAGKGLAGKIAKTGKPIIVVDAAEEPLITKPEIRQAFRSVWGVPLSVAGKGTGVLHLGFSQEYHCMPRELKLLEAISERCAHAIEKAQLIEELHDREEQIRRLGEHMLTVEEEERRRISRELHDEVGQSMLVIRLYIEMVQSDLPASAKHLNAKLDDTRRLTEQTIREMRRLISDLSPNVLEQLGLPASIRQCVTNFSRGFSGKVQLRMTRVDNLPRGSQIMLYRLVQECFTNVIKHSCAENVVLNLSRGNGFVKMKMHDDGIGFDVEQATHKHESFGLSGMRERVALLGGRIEIRSSPGKGTRVEIAIPV